MKDKIKKEVLGLNSGEEFTFKRYFDKYGIVKMNECMPLFGVLIEELGENITPKIEQNEGMTPVIGIPYNQSYIRK